MFTVQQTLLWWSNQEGWDRRDIYRVSQEERLIFWEVIVCHSKKKVYMNMCPTPNGFRYLARNIFLLSLSMNNHNSKLTLHTDSHASDIGALRGKEGKYCAPNSKYCAPNIGNRSEQDTCSYKRIFLEWPILWPPRILTALSSWDTLYNGRTKWEMQPQCLSENLEGWDHLET
jgi:hypothetical protein